MQTFVRSRDAVYLIDGEGMLGRYHLGFRSNAEKCGGKKIELLYKMERVSIYSAVDEMRDAKQTSENAVEKKTPTGHQPHSTTTSAINSKILYISR